MQKSNERVYSRTIGIDEKTSYFSRWRRFSRDLCCRLCIINRVAIVATVKSITVHNFLTNYEMKI